MLSNDGVLFKVKVTATEELRGNTATVITASANMDSERRDTKEGAATNRNI